MRKCSDTVDCASGSSSTVTAHPGVLTCEHAEDPHADRVSQSFGEGCEFLVSGRVCDWRREPVERAQTLRGTTV